MMNVSKQQIITLLPIEVVASILRYANANDIGSISATCKTFRDCANQWIPFVLDSYFGGNKKQMSQFLSVSIVTKKEETLSYYTGLLSWMVKCGLNVNDVCGEEGFTTLLGYASAFGNRNACDALMASGAMIADNWPLYLAVLKGYIDIVELLINIGVDVNQKKEDINPLFLAAALGHKDIVNMLVTIGNASVDAKALDGETPLFIAAFKGNKDIVKILIAAGADVNKTTDYGITPLQIAKQMEYAGILVLMVTETPQPTV